MFEQKEFLRYLGFSILIFLIGFAGGLLMTQADPTVGTDLMNLFKEMVADGIMDGDPSLVALQIFLNNLQACVVLFLGGAFFGLLTLFILASNGVIIGAVLEIIRQENGMMMVLAGIVPHGLFELPAVFVSGALGLMLSRAVVRELAGQGSAADEAIHLARLFIQYVVPFIAIAACIEAFITTAVLQMVT